MRASIAALAATLLVAGCAGGLMLNAAPPRSDDIFSRIHPGMTRDEVAQLIGKPDETMAFPRSNTDSWGYQYYDTWGYMAIFSVTFDATGHAVSKFSRRINAGGDHSR